MKIKIYSGISLTKKDVNSILPSAEFSGPISRGDLLNDIKQRYNVIGIIDGKFDQSMAVAPSEIMDAMRSGVKIYGSSSMGAMRAAECDNYGMTGIGEIYKFVKESELFRDDYLAQTFTPDFSESLFNENRTWVDLFFFCKSDVQNNTIKADFSERILKAYAKIFYSERSLTLLRKTLEQNGGLSESERGYLVSLLNRQGQKFTDGIDMMTVIKNDLEKIKATNLQIELLAQKSNDPAKYYPAALTDRNFFKKD